MKMFVFAVRDEKSGLFALPWFVASRGIAVRMFTDEVNRVASDNVMNKHFADFCLCALGEFDNVSGMFESKVPEQVCDGSIVHVPV